MAKKRWNNRELLADIALDVNGWSIKVHKITWLDNSQCIQIMKYGKRPLKPGSDIIVDVPYHPLQYIQLPVSVAQSVIDSIVESMRG